AEASPTARLEPANLGLELVKEILGCTGDDPIANQEQRRALQIELARKVHALVERFLDIGVLRVLLELVDVESKLLGNPQGFILVSVAGLGEQLLVHLEIFALLVRGERSLAAATESSLRIGSSLRTSRTFPSSLISLSTSGSDLRQ